MGFIEMHINTDSFCGIQEINRTINIIRECIDLDTDGVDDAIDNCPGISNLFQSDLDQDGIGDACDEDESTLNNVGIGVEILQENCI